MKNIAIPLLLANSANVQGQFQGGPTTIKQDKAVAKPILIADAYNPNDCIDAAGAVAAANTALTTAASSLSTLNTEMEPLNTALATAQTAKDTAVAAVIAADAALATNLAADDTAQGLVLTTKSLLDQAIITEAAAIADAAAAVTDEAAAQTTLTAETATQTAMSTAATAAATHYTHEQGQTTTVETDRAAAQTAHTTAAGLESGLQTLYNNAKTTSDGTATTAAASLSAKNDAEALATALATIATAAAAAVNVATDPSVAKTKNDADGILTTKSSDLDTAAGTWQGLAKNVVKDVKTWKAGDQLSYTEVHANQGCTATNVTAAESAGNEAACKTVCDGKLPWAGLTSPINDQVPTAVLAAGGSSGGAHAATTICYGVDWKVGDSTCFLVQDDIPTAAGGSDIAQKCSSRDFSVLAKSLVANTALATTSVASWTSMDASLTLWATQQDAVLTATGPLNVATEYKTLIDTAKGNADSASTSAGSTYTTDSGTETTNNALTATALTNLTNQQTTIATLNAAWQALETQKTAQVAEEAAQLVIKNNADAELTAQNAVVTAATTAQSTAAGLVTTTATASTAATTAKGTAQTNYDNAVTAAAATATAIATPLSELATLRATSATETSNLATAVQNVADQQSLIDSAMTVVETKSNQRIAAIVSCKEERYDEYYATLQQALATRQSDLDTIQRLIDAADAAAPARGAKGSRCEKAMSNGTFRPARGETTCDEGLCCGAARIPQGNVMMTIETCQPEATTEFNWAPPRAPMATAMPASDPYPFTCIQGAQKLAAAASALATAVYMLA